MLTVTAEATLVRMKKIGGSYVSGYNWNNYVFPSYPTTNTISHNGVTYKTVPFVIVGGEDSMGGAQSQVSIVTAAGPIETAVLKEAAAPSNGGPPLLIEIEIWSLNPTSYSFESRVRKEIWRASRFDTDGIERCSLTLTTPGNALTGRAGRYLNTADVGILPSAGDIRLQ